MRRVRRGTGNQHRANNGKSTRLSEGLGSNLHKRVATNTLNALCFTITAMAKLPSVSKYTNGWRGWVFFEIADIGRVHAARVPKMSNKSYALQISPWASKIPSPSCPLTRCPDLRRTEPRRVGGNAKESNLVQHIPLASSIARIREPHVAEQWGSPLKQHIFWITQQAHYTSAK